MKSSLLIFFILLMPMISWAETAVPEKKQNTEITMTTTQAMQLAGALVDRGDYEHATQIMTLRANYQVDFIYAQ